MIENLAFSFIFTLSAYSLVNAQSAASSGPITWGTCKQNSTLPISCATLSVPLDYTDSASTETIRLSLLRIPATKEPRQGSILFNPGGPGIVPTDFLSGEFGGLIFESTGGYHDLIAFDTRGTGNTLPFSCFDDDFQRTISLIKTPVSTNSSDVALGTAWAGKQALGQSCYNKNRDTGDLLGTTFVARDMMQIVDALNEDGMLRYYGLSYGTALGATVVAMFPDKVDRVVLDGVLNPSEHYYGGFNDSHIQTVADSDVVWRAFLSSCIDAPEGKCALARPGATASGLEQEFIDFIFDKIKFNPIAAGPPEQTSIIDYSAVKSIIQPSLSLPATWPALAAALDGLYHNDPSAFFELSSQLSAGSPPTYTEISSGIRCSDRGTRVNSLDEARPLIETYYNQSYTIGDVVGPVSLTCAQWPFKAKERYTGGFNNIRPKNPVLIIGNTFDPLTPLAAARNLSDGISGSVLLQHDGYGHCSIASPSNCTLQTIGQYFTNGTLPAEGTKCEPNVPLFGN